MKNLPVFSSGMLHHAVLVVLTFLFFLITSCETQEPRTARSVGVTSEILVVTQNKEQWNGLIGESIRSYFGQPQYGLPQEEPIYRIAQIDVENLSDMFQKHRNLLLVETGSGQETPIVETKSDLWAKPQRVVKIRANNPDQWSQAFDEHKESIRLLFDRAERERLLNIFRPTAKPDVAEALFKHMGVSMIIPEGFFVAKKESGFIWIRRETAENSQGIIIYKIPYRDTLQLTAPWLTYTRDSIVSRHIPGPSPGSFMTTDKEFVPPMISRVNYFIEDFAVENRGMWKLIGDFMAGPYLSYTLVDRSNGQLITIEGYVYAPNKDKRDLLRQLEAIMFSLNLNP
jgi:hypothetical protein